MNSLRSPWVLIGAAAVAGVPAVALRWAGVHLDPWAAALLFGFAILTAAFLIGTGAEASQRDIPAALSVAVIALIAVLPEYAVDLLLAFEAASDVTGAASELDNCLDPGTSRELIQERAAAGGNTETCKGPLALANMTGANRLLLGVGWNFLFTGGTALVTETYAPEEKAKVQGLNDFIIWGTISVGAVAAGAVQQTIGWEAVNLVMAPLVIVVFAATLWLRLAARRTARQTA